MRARLDGPHVAGGRPQADPPELVWNDREHLDVAGELEGQRIVARMMERARSFHPSSTA